MLKRLLLASALLVPATAQATPLDAVNRTTFIDSAIEACLQPGFATRAYCLCFAVNAADRTTLEDAFYTLTNNGNVPSDMLERVFKPALFTCQALNKTR